MSDDKLKALLAEAKSKGANEEQLVGIAQTYFSSKKKDSTELPSTGEVETTPSPSTIQPPGWLGVGGAPLRKYEVKKQSMTADEKKEMWSSLGWEEQDFDMLERASRGAKREQDTQIAEQLGIDVDAPDNIESLNADLRKAQQVIATYQDQITRGVNLGGVYSTPEELTEEQKQRFAQDAINQAAEALGLDPQGLDIDDLSDRINEQKNITESILFDRTVDRAAWKELTETPSFKYFDGLADKDFTYTRTATSDFVYNLANRAVVMAADVIGKPEVAEEYEQKIKERGVRANMELGIDLDDSRGAYETFKDGDIALGFKKLTMMAAQSWLPMASAIVNPASAVAIAGTSGTLGTYEAYRDRGDLTEEQKFVLSFGSGIAEGYITQLGMGNVRRARAAMGVADDIGRASMSQKRAAYQKAIDYLKPYTDEVTNVLNKPAVRGTMTFARDLGEEQLEELSIAAVQQGLAYAVANDEFDPYEFADTFLTTLLISSPTAAVTGARDYSIYSTINAMPTKEKLGKFEELKKDYALIKESLKKDELSKREKNILKNELLDIKKEMNNMKAEAVAVFESLNEEDKQKLLNTHNQIKKMSKVAKETDSESVRAAAKRLINLNLEEKNRIEQGLPFVERAAEPEMPTPRQRPVAMPTVAEPVIEEAPEGTEPIVDQATNIFARGEVTLEEPQKESISKIATALKNIAPGIIFELHSSRDTYNQTYDGAERSKGHYNPNTNKIHILVDKDNPLNVDGWLLLKHEAIHPVLDALLATDVNYANNLESSIKSLMNKYAANTPEQKRVLDHANRYKGRDDESLELLTEFLAVFSQPDVIIKLQKQEGFLERIKEILQSILRRLGIDATVPEKEEQLRSLLNDVSEAFYSGRQFGKIEEERTSENRIRESIDRIQDGKDPYANAARPKRGSETVAFELAESGSNFLIAEDFEHSLELRRMGYVEKTQLPDGSILLSAPVVYEKPEIDGIFSVHSKSFIKEKDIQDKKQKAVAKTLNALAEQMDLPIAFINRPDLNFNASLTYPDGRNDLDKATMVVNLHYANARTGASPFSFAIVDAIRKQKPKVIGDLIKSLENELGASFVSPDIRATYNSYKESSREWRDLSDAEVQFYALSMSIQETIDRVLNKAVHIRMQSGAINFLTGIQKQFAEVLNEEMKKQTGERGVFSKLGLEDDFIDLLDKVFVKKRVKADFSLTPDQKKISTNILENLKKYLSGPRNKIDKIRRVANDVQEMQAAPGIALLDVLQDIADSGTFGVSDENIEKLFNEIISRNRYQKFLNLSRIMDKEIADAIYDFMITYGVNYDRINLKYNEVYSQFTEWAAEGFSQEFLNKLSEDNKSLLNIVRKYYESLPRSQADYLVNKFAGKIDASAFEADLYGKELVLGAFNLDLTHIGEIAGMPYDMLKQSVVYGESGFDLLMQGVEAISIYQQEIEDIIVQAAQRAEAIESVSSEKLDKAKSISEVIRAFERKGLQEDLEALINKGTLDKQFPFEHTDENGNVKEEFIVIGIKYEKTGPDTFGLMVDFDNTINEKEYRDNKINDSALSTKTLTTVFRYTKDVAELLGIEGIMFNPVAISKDVLNEEGYAENLKYAAKGRDTRWYRRALYNRLGIIGGLIARPNTAVAFYDPEYNEDFYYITESTYVLGEASARSEDLFNDLAFGVDRQGLTKIASKSTTDFIGLLSEDLQSDKSNTQAIAIDKTNPDWKVNLALTIAEVNRQSSVFSDADEMLNVDLQTMRFESNRSRISPTAIRESLLDPEQGREAADAVDGMFQSSEEMIKEQGKKKFSLRKLFGMEGREAFIDPQAKLRKAVEKGFGDYMRSLIRNQAGATAYADREFVRLKKEIFGGLSSTEEILLDKIIFLERVIQIDSNWDARLRENKRKLAVVESELEQLKEKEKSEEVDSQIEAKERIKKYLQGQVNKYSTRPKHPTSGNIAMNLENAQAAIAHYKRTIGEETYAKLKERETKYFDAYKMILDESYKAGIINKETRDRFITQNYSPRLFLSKMFGDTDDIMWEGTNLSKDQIQSIKDGSDTEIFTDAQYMLSLSIRSLRNKEAKNNFLSSLGKELGNKDLSWIKQANYKKDSEGNFIEDDFGGRILENPSEGFKHVMYRENGALRAFQVSNDYYDVISGKDSRRLFNPATRRLLAKASGTKLVKLFATGIKPVFSITATMRYFQEVTRGRGVYDAYYVLPFMQLVAITDFVKGTGAAVLDSEVVEEYFKYGGGMSFMTLQGKPDQLYKRKNSRMTRLMGKYSPVKGAINVLAYAGEKAELGARIAIYQRTLKNLQKSRPELTEDQMKSLAVEEARMIADFSQGGYISKDLDALKPYLNASIQGTVGTVDYIRRNPKMFTNKLIQSMLVNTAITYLLKSLIGDDEYEKIPPYEKIRYNHIPLYKNKDGKWVTKRIPKAHQFMFVDIQATLAGEYFYSITHEDAKEFNLEMLKKDPAYGYYLGSDGEAYLESLISSLPAGDFIPTSLKLSDFVGEVFSNVPVIGAYDVYENNFNRFKQQKVSYDYDRVHPYMEGFKDGKTRDVYRFISDASFKYLPPAKTISAPRLQAAAEKLITNESNTVVGLAYNILDYIITTSDEAAAISPEKRFKKFDYDFGLKRTFIYTIPDRKYDFNQEKIMDAIDKSERGKMKEITTNLRILLSKGDYEFGQTVPQEIMNYIKSLEPLDQKFAGAYTANALKGYEVDPIFIEVRYSANGTAAANKLKLRYGFNSWNDLPKDMQQEISAGLTKAGYRMDLEFKAAIK